MKLFNKEITLLDPNFLKQYMLLSSKITGMNMRMNNHNVYRFIVSEIEFICNLIIEKCDHSDDFFREYLHYLEKYYDFSKFIVVLYGNLESSFLMMRSKMNVGESDDNYYSIFDSFDYNWKTKLYVSNANNLNEKLFDFLNNFREGKISLELAKKTVTNIARSVSFGDTDFDTFGNYTLIPLIENLFVYYKKYIKNFIQNNNQSDYIRKAKNILDDHETIFEIFRNEKNVSVEFEENGKKSIKTVVKHGDIYKNISRFFHEILFLEKYRNLFAGNLENVILNETDQDVIGITYYFYSKNDIMSEFSKLIGNIMWKDLTKIIDSYKDLVEDKMNLYEKICFYYNKYYVKILDMIPNHQDQFTVSNALSVKMREFINYDFKGLSNIAIVLADITDMMLIKNTGMFDKMRLESDDIEKHINNVCNIISFINDKDYFMNFYKKALSKRLLSDSCNEDNEKAFLSRFKVIFGNEFITRVRGMIDDISGSLNLCEEYRKCIRDDSLNLIIQNSSFKILRCGVWPIKPDEKQILAHPKFINTMQNFTNYYNQLFNGRVLKWLQDDSDAVMYYHAGGKKYEITCNFIQSSIMLTMNDIEPKPGVASSKNSLCISKATLMKTLDIGSSLFDNNVINLIRSGVLKCNAKEMTNGIPDATLFIIGDVPKSKTLKFNIKPKEIQAEKKKKEETEDINAIIADRNYVIQSAIVRILKTVKEIKPNDLILRSIEIVNEKFRPNTKDVKKNIDILIEKEYMERVKSKEGEKYVYLA